MDSERLNWVLDPFRSVGPLRFGISQSDAEKIVEEIDCRYAEKGNYWRLEHRGYSRSGVKLYFTADDRLQGVSVDAIRGPQVFMGGRALVAQVPSMIDEWVFQYADNVGEGDGVGYLGTGDIVSLVLGVAFCVQRSGDHLITRPVFLSDREMVAHDCHHHLPDDAWDFF